MADEEIAVPATEQQKASNIERKLIKEGRVEFETRGIDSSRKTVGVKIWKKKIKTVRNQWLKGLNINFKKELQI